MVSPYRTKGRGRPTTAGAVSRARTRVDCDVASSLVGTHIPQFGLLRSSSDRSGRALSWRSRPHSNCRPGDHFQCAMSKICPPRTIECIATTSMAPDGRRHQPCSPRLMIGRRAIGDVVARMERKTAVTTSRVVLWFWTVATDVHAWSSVFQSRAATDRRDVYDASSPCMAWI